MNVLFIRRKIPYKAIFFNYFLCTCHKSRVMNENVKQYSISCPTLVSRYVSLNILSEKTFTVRKCVFISHVRLRGGQLKNKDSVCCQARKMKGIKCSCLSMDNLKTKS